jgi:hypothetical protein
MYNYISTLSVINGCMEPVSALENNVATWIPTFPFVEENRPGRVQPATQQGSVARSILQMKNLARLELVSFSIETFLLWCISRAEFSHSSGLRIHGPFPKVRTASGI